MKKFLQNCFRSAALVAAVACLIALTSLSAQAQKFNQKSDQSVYRAVYQGETHTGLCCAAWDPSVTIREQEKVAPIIVTFSADYRATGPVFAGVKLNDGPCVFAGPAFLPTFSADDHTYSSRTFQWVIMPGDYKLARGKNVITVCGGAILSATDSIELGFVTLTAHLQE